MINIIGPNSVNGRIIIFFLPFSQICRDWTNLEVVNLAYFMN